MSLERINFFAGLLALICLNMVGGVAIDEAGLPGWVLAPWIGYCLGSGWVYGALAARLGW